MNTTASTGSTGWVPDQEDGKWVGAKVGLFAACFAPDQAGGYTNFHGFYIE